MKFGDYLRQAREKHGWTQPEAAAKASIEQSYLSKLETGKSYPSEDIFTRLVSVYGLDVKEMASSLFSAELDKLREIAEVRTVVLARQQTEAGFVRSWLIAGLIMLMLSGGTLGLAFNAQEAESYRYFYQSAGVIRDSEPPRLFDFLEHPGPEDDKKIHLISRVDYAFMDTPRNRERSFIERVDGGYRYFELQDVKKEQKPSLIVWHYAFGFMFLFGGIGCFFISRRWR